jgi:two-component system, LytTR family, sensor kinase
LIHILYWALFICLLMLIFAIMAAIPGYDRVSGGKINGFRFWIKLVTGFAIIPGLVSFYITYTVLFNQFLSKKKFVSFCILGIIVSILAAVIGALVESMSFLFGSGYLFGNGYNSALSILLVMSIGALINGVIGAILKGFITWYNDIKIKDDLQKKNYQMELNLIKSQVNPHFLFNTLNNIDVLIDRDKDKASMYFKKLSDILRFMLYETKTDKIPLSKELSYIEKYIDLQMLRNSNPAFIDFKVKGEPGSRMVDPMLFIPFIENAFKHADNKKLVHAIIAGFDLTGKDIVFECSNNFTANKPKENDSFGLGNDLIEKRLALLYPKNHQLTITKDSNRYTVNLIIQEKHDLYNR